MRFTDPAYLLLVIPVLLGLVMSYRHVHGMARSRKRLAFAVRFVLASLLILALAGPESRRKNEGLCTIFLIDRSDSVPDAQRQKAEHFVDQALQKLGPKEQAGVVVFGRAAVVESAPGGRRPLGLLLSRVDGSASDLSSAVRLASASFPDGKARRIVVLSDGNQTSGDLLAAAAVASTDGIPIDFVPLGTDAGQAEVAVLDLQVPSEMPANQPFDIRVIVDSTDEQEALLSLDRDDLIVREVVVRLSAGHNALVVSDRLPKSGFHRYRATVRAREDRDSRNNVGMGFVAVRGRPRTLVLQQKPSAGLLVKALRQAGLEVDSAGPGAPLRPEDLQSYDSIIFNDINAASILPRQMRLIQSAVRDGGIGFAMVGGENSFLPGGYYGTPIAEILPVDLNIRQRKTYPSTSICIMADASGSMSMPEDGVTKIRLAAKAAEETVKLMAPRDRVGVAGSTDGIQFVAPMQPLTNKEAVISQIRLLSTGGGGIYVRPTLLEAEKVLAKEPSQVKHFILLADGNDCDQQEGCIEIGLRMRANKITMSVVSIGDGKDVAFLRRLALAGGGRFYLAKRASQLPAIFTQDAAVMSRSAIEEGAFYPKLIGGEEILRGIDSTPPLLAYNLADSRPLARTSMRTHKDDPLLAVWQYGLGTSLAFTSDAQARWAQNWISWEGFGTFWSQAARAIARRSTLNEYDVKVSQQDGKGIVEIRAADSLGNALTTNQTRARVATPSGQSRELVLSQVAPGQFTASFDVTELGIYIVTLAEPSPAGERVSSRGFAIAYPAEYRTTRTNTSLLARAAEATQGRQIERPEDALAPVPNPGESISALWPLFVLWAALLLPLDVGVRRIALPVAEILARALAAIRLRRQVASPQQVVVERLHQAKQRVRASAPSPETRQVQVAPDDVVPAEREAAAATPRRNESGADRAAGSKLLDAKRRRKGG